MTTEKTEFAVFANGTFWGAFTAETAEEAIQDAADEFGTDGNTDGMTAMTYKELKDAVEAAGVELTSAEIEHYAASGRLNKAEDEMDRLNALLEKMEIELTA